MINIPKDKELILFDGVCNLCNSSVQYVIKHDNKSRFLFAPLQSKIGEEIIETYNIDQTKTDSIVLYSISRGLSLKSTAALKIVKHLGFPRNILVVFLIVPAAIRNWVYDFIAKNRYKWYGRTKECMIPTPELRSRFIQ